MVVCAIHHHYYYLNTCLYNEDKRNIYVSILMYVLGLLAHFNVVEANMRFRRLEATELLKENEYIMSLTSFPRLGCPNFTFPSYKPRPDDENCVARSLYFVDEAIFPGHARFKTLTRNIRMRRGSKVAIDLPGIFNFCQRIKF